MPTEAWSTSRRSATARRSTSAGRRASRAWPGGTTRTRDSPGVSRSSSAALLRQAAVCLRRAAGRDQRGRVDVRKVVAVVGGELLGGLEQHGAQVLRSPDEVQTLEGELAGAGGVRLAGTSGDQ